MDSNPQEGSAMADKQQGYRVLVGRRKECRACEGLLNPSVCLGGQCDSDQIGVWSRWQGDLDAEIMVVGQDWGDRASFEKQRGEDVASPTNRTLCQLLQSAGIMVSLPGKTTAATGLFFTNAILCLKDAEGTQGRAQARVRPEWLETCGEYFLKPLIDLVGPKLVICLGKLAYRSVLAAHGLDQVGDFAAVVEWPEPVRLCESRVAFAVYHCSPTVVNTHPRRKQQRTRDWQQRDWERVAAVVRELRNRPA